MREGENTHPPKRRSARKPEPPSAQFSNMTMVYALHANDAQYDYLTLVMICREWQNARLGRLPFLRTVSAYLFKTAFKAFVNFAFVGHGRNVDPAVLCAICHPYLIRCQPRNNLSQRTRVDALKVAHRMVLELRQPWTNPHPSYLPASIATL